MFKQDVLLDNYSRYKIGGPAKYFIDVSTKQELVKVIKAWREFSKTFPKNAQQIYVLGDGTNLLISEKGFPGLVIHNQIGGISLKGKTVTVGSGVLVSELLDFCINNSLSGFEWAAGLPGTVGGAIRGDAGAFGGETKDSVVKVVSINAQTLKETTRDKWECSFAYRYSIFKTEQVKDEIITQVVLEFKTGDKKAIQKIIDERIAYRIEKHPMDLPSIGSTFKNINYEKLPKKLQDEFKASVKIDPFPVIPAAKFLILSGVKGKREGDAQFSEKHPNFIVNHGHATSQDVKKLIAFAKQAVKKDFGVALEEEIIYL
jgi:UDP-N-acetylmuramate dehydrogenase